MSCHKADPDLSQIHRFAFQKPWFLASIGLLYFLKKSGCPRVLNNKSDNCRTEQPMSRLEKRKGQNS